MVPASSDRTLRSASVRRRRPLVYRGREISCTLSAERAAWAAGTTHLAGVDEVGRGALFGPVVAGAVVLPPGFDPTGIDDSKRLTPRCRETQARRIKAESQAWALGEASSEEVDTVGIVQATHAAMRRAVAALSVRPEILLIDGREVAGFSVPQRAMVKGDALCVSIACASILAKVARDALMRQWDERFPAYGLARNAGYGTPEHLAALRRHGPTPFHRRSFGRQKRLFDDEMA